MQHITWLIGRSCQRVWEHYPQNFTFDFDGGLLAVDCLWRIVGESRVALTSSDHGQQFGLPSPINACVEAERLLRDHRVTAVNIRAATADLILVFESGYQLEIVADSSGYEPWNFTAPGIHLVAVGGGGIADFSPSASDASESRSGGS